MQNLIANWPLTGDYGTVQPGMSFLTDEATAGILLERGDARLAPAEGSAKDIDVTGTPPANPPGPTAGKQDKSAATRQTKVEK